MSKSPSFFARLFGRRARPSAGAEAAPVPTTPALDPDQVHDRTTLCRAAFQDHPKVFEDRLEELTLGLAESAVDGYVLEFGVFKGTSVNHLGKMTPDTAVWGFDSFEGLPEAWHRSKAGDTYEAGHFALPGLPEVRPNVNLVKGFFDATLEPWLAAHEGPVRLLHIDVDLYSSTRYVLDQLNDRILPGTVIVFDELCDWRDSGVYDRWEEGEWKALLEWLEIHDRKIRILSRAVEWAAAVIVVQ